MPPCLPFMGGKYKHFGRLFVISAREVGTSVILNQSDFTVLYTNAFILNEIMENNPNVLRRVAQ